VSCQDIVPYLEAFVDQELSPERTLDVERHVASCPSCRAEVDMARTLAAVTRSAVSEVPCCPNFRARLGRSLAEERRRQESPIPAAGNKALPWRTISPIAAAAAIAVLFGATQRHDGSGKTAPLLASTENQLMDMLLQHHSSPPKPALTALDSIKGMEPRLGFPVHPPNLERFGARFVGANLVNVDRTPAASLHYSLNNGRRLTFYVYDPEKLPLRAAVHTLHPRVVQNQAVFVGHRRGYSIATCERHGVGYAVTTELGDTESAELVAALDR
jgi:anti-sigma factor RsiW